MKGLLPAALLVFSSLHILSAQTSFKPYEVRGLGAVPQSVTIADFNSDGRNDLAVMTTFAGPNAENFKLLIFYQNEQRMLDEPVKYAAPESFQGNRFMITYDLDLDGRLDILFTHQDSVGIFYGAASGGFAPAVNLYSGEITHAVAAGDLNHDGRPDFAVSNDNVPFMSIFYGSPDGTFSKSEFPVNLHSSQDLEIGDFNNDQLDDLAFLGSYPVGGLYLSYQQTDGSMSTPSFLLPSVQPDLPSTPYSIGVGDLNGDGKTDLVTSTPHNTGANLNLWMQGDNGIMTTPSVRPAFHIPEPVEIKDVNCDGFNEIVTLHGGWLRMSVYEGAPVGLYNYYHSFGMPYYSHYNVKGMAVDDLNGDGMLDVAAVGGNELVLLYNNGSNSIFNPTPGSTILGEIITTLETDTIFILPSTFTHTTVDTLGYLRLVRTDSLLATQYWVQTVTNLDSVLLKRTGICTGIVTDTLHGYYTYSENMLAGIDTALIATRVDTFYLPVPQGPFTFTIYPNPNRGQVFIQFSDRVQSGFLSAELFAADGKRVGINSYDYVWENERLLRLDFLSYSTGVYTLRFKSEQVTFTEKLIRIDR